MLKAHPNTWLPAVAVAVLTSAPHAFASDSNLHAWDDKWRKVDSAPGSVSLADHWRVCDLKFRFRNYQDLFRCLELIEQRVAKLDEHSPARRYTPVLVGWMRASAYAELGEVEEALKWAESAWQGLPEAYHKDPAWVFQCRDPAPNPNGTAELMAVGALLLCRMAHKYDFAGVAIDAGGFRPTAWVGSDASVIGQRNPAGLDIRPQTIAMDLAAERSVLHQQRGETALARAALEDLYKWKLAGNDVVDVNLEAGRLAIGPLFALGNYAAVVENYDRWAKWKRGNKSAARFGNILFLGMPNAVNKLLDFRKFATALEDASTKYLYATSLARLGKTEEAEKAFDEMLAAPELADMGSIYWAVLYERSGIALKRGQRADAIRLLQQAVDAIERVRTSITFESGKIGFAGSKQTVYAALVRALAESGDWRGAFAAAERAKARALVDLLAQVHEVAPPPEASEKVRQLLASAETSEGQIGFAVSVESSEARGRLLTARGELPKFAPEAASLVSVQTASLEEIAARLAPSERLLNYFQAGDDLYAFVLNGTEVKGFKLPVAGLDEQIRAFRAAIENPDSPSAAKTAGRTLYERLMGPLISELPGDKLDFSPRSAALPAICRLAGRELPA